MRDMIDKLRNFGMHSRAGAWERENEKKLKRTFAPLREIFF